MMIAAVLLLDLGVIHSRFCGSARKLLRGRAGERLRCPRGSDAFGDAAVSLFIQTDCK